MTNDEGLMTTIAHTSRTIVVISPSSLVIKTLPHCQRQQQAA